MGFSVNLHRDWVDMAESRRLSARWRGRGSHARELRALRGELIDQRFHLIATPMRVCYLSAARLRVAAISRCRAQNAGWRFSDAYSRYPAGAEAARSQPGSGPGRGLVTAGGRCN